MRGAAVNGNAFQFLEWGRTFRPFLTNVAAPAAGARPGTVLFLSGSLGEQRFSPEIVTAAGVRIPLSVNTWTGAGGTFTLPSSWVPPGKHRVLLFDGALKEASSNSWPLTIADPCQYWITDNFTPAQIAAGDTADGADPDRDGQANLIEMIMGTNPVAANPIPWTWSLANPSAPVISYNVRTDRCAVRLILQASTDLTTWADEASQTITPTLGAANTASGFMSAPAGPASGRTFRRLKIQRL